MYVLVMILSLCPKNRLSKRDGQRQVNRRRKAGLLRS
jgi:hypothetical protein